MLEQFLRQHFIRASIPLLPGRIPRNGSHEDRLDARGRRGQSYASVNLREKAREIGQSAFERAIIARHPLLDRRSREISRQEEKKEREREREREGGQNRT